MRQSGLTAPALRTGRTTAAAGRTPVLSASYRPAAGDAPHLPHFAPLSRPRRGQSWACGLPGVRQRIRPFLSRDGKGTPRQDEGPADRKNALYELRTTLAHFSPKGKGFLRRPLGNAEKTLFLRVFPLVVRRERGYLSRSYIHAGPLPPEGAVNCKHFQASHPPTAMLE